MPDYDRLLQTCLREAERGIMDLVERKFADLPITTWELPWIGAFPYSDRPDQKKFAVAALTAKLWFTYEGPRWAQPLELSHEACVELIDNPGRCNRRRAMLRGCYGLHARSVLWDIGRMTPFEVFCANELAPHAAGLRS
jgi:hypothetical protein